MAVAPGGTEYINGCGAWLVPLDQPGPVPWWPRPLPMSVEPPIGAPWLAVSPAGEVTLAGQAHRVAQAPPSPVLWKISPPYRWAAKAELISSGKQNELCPQEKD
jgi:hypothetical protein